MIPLVEEQERWAEAAELYPELIKLAPDDLYLYHGFGTCLYHLGRLNEALEALEEAARIDPEDESIRSERDYVRAELAGEKPGQVAETPLNSPPPG